MCVFDKAGASGDVVESPPGGSLTPALVCPWQSVRGGTNHIHFWGHSFLICNTIRISFWKAVVKAENAPAGLAIEGLVLNAATGAGQQPNYELVIYSLVGSRDHQLLIKSRSWPGG